MGRKDVTPLLKQLSTALTAHSKNLSQLAVSSKEIVKILAELKQTFEAEGGFETPLVKSIGEVLMEVERAQGNSDKLMDKVGDVSSRLSNLSTKTLDNPETLSELDVVFFLFEACFRINRRTTAIFKEDPLSYSTGASLPPPISRSPPSSYSDDEGDEPPPQLFPELPPPIAPLPPPPGSGAQHSSFPTSLSSPLFPSSPHLNSSGSHPPSPPPRTPSHQSHSTGGQPLPLPLSPAVPPRAPPREDSSFSNTSSGLTSSASACSLGPPPLSPRGAKVPPFNSYSSSNNLLQRNPQPQKNSYQQQPQQPQGEGRKRSGSDAKKEKKARVVTPDEDGKNTPRFGDQSGSGSSGGKSTSFSLSKGKQNPRSPSKGHLTHSKDVPSQPLPPSAKEKESKEQKKKPKSTGSILKKVKHDSVAKDLSIEPRQQATETKTAGSAEDPLSNVTLERLVEALTNEKTLDLQLRLAFFLTYKRFTTPFQLLSLLIARYKNEASEQLSNEQLKARKLRVVSIIKYWMEECNDDIFDSPDALQCLTNFFSYVEGEAEPTGKLLIKLFEKEKSQRQPKQAKPDDCPPLNLAWDSFDEEEVSIALTQYEYNLFSAIPLDQLLYWNQKERNTHCTAIYKFIDLSNWVSSWVTSELVSKFKRRDRVRLFEKFISLAEHLLDLQNFSGCMAVLAGIGNSSFWRMKLTRSEAGEGYLESYEKMKTRLTSKSNYSAYRSYLKGCTPPSIPYLGIYLKEITFIDDGNSDSQYGLINFYKWKLMASVVEEVKFYQTTKYLLTPRASFGKAKDSIVFGENCQDEWQFYSHLVEPKDAEAAIEQLYHLYQDNKAQLESYMGGAAGYEEGYEGGYEEGAY